MRSASPNLDPAATRQDSAAAEESGAEQEPVRVDPLVSRGLDLWDSIRMPDSDERAAERVWRDLPAGTRQALERALPPTDLQTLLIAVARIRAGQVTAADVMRRWEADRFVRPAARAASWPSRPGSGSCYRQSSLASTYHQ